MKQLWFNISKENCFILSVILADTFKNYSPSVPEMFVHFGEMTYVKVEAYNRISLNATIIQSRHCDMRESNAYMVKILNYFTFRVMETVSNIFKMEERYSFVQ